MLTFLMPSKGFYWLPSALLLAVWLAVSAPRSEAGRVACSEVISEVNREARVHRDDAVVDISRVARKLRTTVPWTEHCMRAYGRRPKRPGIESAESREAELEAFEEDEPEEEFPEDQEEAGAPDLKVREERQRIMKIKPPPTPVEGNESREGFDEGFGR